MGLLGGILGHSLGRSIAKALHIPKEAGGVIGGGLGTALEPFKTGGKVKGKKGQPVPILAHGNEYVLPTNAKPTKKQKAIVAKNKKLAKKGIKFLD